MSLVIIFCSILALSQDIGKSQTVENGKSPPMPKEIMEAELKDLSGESFSLADYKGEVVLINLWGIWCGPCLPQMPKLAALQHKYHDLGLEVIGLNIGDSNGAPEAADKIQKFGERLHLD